MLFKKNKKSISPLIASILVIVVAVALIVTIVIFGKNFTKNNLDLSSDIVETIYSKSELSGYIYQEKIENFSLYLKNIHPSQNITIIGYKINYSSDKYYLNKNLFLEDLNLSPVYLPSNGLAQLPLVCFPERSFNLELIFDDNTYTNLKINNTITNIDFCTMYTINFLDFDNTILKTENIRHGSSTTPPSDPERTSYSFTGWSPSDFSNIVEDTNFVAEYLINTYTLNYFSSIGGTIDGNTSQTIEHGSSGTQITAVPDIDYAFVSWSDGVLTESRTDTNITEDLEVTANFEYSIDFGLFAWGDSSTGQLGDPDFVVWEPKDINLEFDIVSAGSDYSLGIRDGKLYSWGYNNRGQLGLGDTNDRNYPVQVGIDEDWTSVFAGQSHSLGIRDGKLYAWGYNTYGQLGLGDTTQRTFPVQVGTDENWSSVSVGRYHSLGIRDGKLYAWGRNNYRQLGLGNISQSTSPLQVGTAEDWILVSSGTTNSLAIKQIN